MKTTLTQELRILAAMALLAATPSVMAQGDDLLSETEDILNSQQIDIDGTFKKESAADRIEKMRKRLENQNEQMVQKKIENIRIKQEQELAGKLQKAFRGNMENLEQMDSVQTYQAAPQRVVAPAPVIEEKEYKNKIIPYAGIRQFNGENVDSFESKINAGITMENMITERLSIGLGLNYTAMDIAERGYFNSFNSFGFNNVDTINYSNLNLSLNGKFFFTVESKIRPYAGLGLGYNRTSLKYDSDQDQQINYGGNFNTYNADDSSISGSNVTGSAMVGAEVAFTDMLGLNLEFNYTRAITSAFDRGGSNALNFGTFGELAENRLEDIGNNLEESDIASLTVGFVIKF